MAGLASRLDAFQRRHKVAGFPLAVTYKFFDDQSNYLAAILTYYTFAAIFPMLLISSSILGFVLQGNEALKDKLLDSALSQFPIVGTALGTPNGLQGSTWAVVAGVLVALYGILGLGQAAQNAVFVAWAIPRNSRPNPFLTRFHSGALLLLAGFAVLVVAALSGVAANADVLGVDVSTGIHWLIDGVSVVVSAAVFAILMQLATPQHQKWRHLVPGALVTAVLWQLLQRGGKAYVGHVVVRSSDVFGLFALTLGLLALIYVAANMAVIGVQVNVVFAKHLYPRALLTPFTDDVELTDADKRAYAAYAQAQRHKGFEKVSVTFDKAEAPLPEPDKTPLPSGHERVRAPKPRKAEPAPEPTAPVRPTGVPEDTGPIFPVDPEATSERPGPGTRIGG